MDAAATTITLALNKTDTGDPKCVRYNWYNAACMPTAGKGLCAIYGAGAGGVASGRRGAGLLVQDAPQHGHITPRPLSP